MAKAAKKPRLKEPTPEDILGLAEYERRIGSLLADIDKHEQKAEELKKKIDERAAARTAPLREQLFALAKAIREYADKHRDNLTEDDTVKIVSILNAGTIRWYETPPSIVVDKEDTDAVISYLIKKYRKRFVRRKVEINKEALGEALDIAREVPGIEVSQTPKFVIKPVGRDDRVECNIDTNRWKIVEASKEDVVPQQKAA